jgi:hypothetical protein
MARHWSRFVSGVTERQAYALDRMAQEADKGNGMALLMEVLGCSSSKVGRTDSIDMRKAVDECFRRWGRK